MDLRRRAIEAAVVPLPMPDITLVEAVTQALAYELEHDEDVVIFGEDVGKNQVLPGSSEVIK